MASEREPAQRSKPMTLIVKKSSVVPALKNVSESGRSGVQTVAQPNIASSQHLKSIPIAQIKIVGSRRTLDEETVRILSLSIEQSGLRIPISVIAATPGGQIYYLVTGAHRLEASKRSGRSTIDAFVMKEGHVAASRWRIEENLLRRDLNVLNTAEATAKWVRLAEADFGHLVQKPSGGRPEGGVARAARQLPIAGKSEEARRKTVERAIRIDKISAEAKTAAINAGFADNQHALLDIAKQPTPEAQVEKVREKVVRKQTARHGRNAKAAMVTPPASTPSASADAGEGLALPAFLDRRDPEEVYASVKATWANSPGMVAAWADAPPVVRERFITEVLLNSATTTPALNATIGKTFKRASRDGLLRGKVGDE